MNFHAHAEAEAAPAALFTHSFTSEGIKETLTRWHLKSKTLISYSNAFTNLENPEN